MVAQNLFFYGIAAVIVYSGFRVVTTNNVVHAALHLVAVLASVAAQYILLAAEFVAATQVLVYIGAIVVLFLFGIMLTRAKLGRDQDLTHKSWPAARPPRSLLFGVMAYALIDEYALDRDAAAGRPPDHHGRRLQHRHRERLDLLHLPRARSRSCPCSCSPPSSAPSSWRGRTDRGRPAPQPVPAARRGPVLPRRLRRAWPARNAVLVLMSIELILNAVNINLIAFGACTAPIAGSVFALFVIAIAAAEVGVGLAIVLLIYRNRRSVDLDDMAEMKG